MDKRTVFDPEALRALRRLQDPGEPDIVAEVLRMFFDDSSQCRRAADDALAAGDATALAVAAHRLRSSAGLLGLQRLQQSAVDLEQVANTGGPTEWAARLFRVQEALGEACEALREASVTSR